MGKSGKLQATAGLPPTKEHSVSTE